MLVHCRYMYEDVKDFGQPKIYCCLDNEECIYPDCDPFESGVCNEEDDEEVKK